MPDANLKVVITAVDKTGKGTKSAAGGFDKMAAAGVAAGAALVAFGVSSVKAYADAEEAQAKLQDTFDRFPRLTDVSIDALRDYNGELQKKTRFDDDAIASGQAVLGQYELTGKQLQDLTPLVADFAAKTGQSFEAASEAVGKGLLGSGKAFKQIGVDFKDTGTQAGNLEQIMQGLRSQVGGFAEEEGKTAAGQAEILKNQFGEVQETVGAELTPVLITLGGVATDALEGFNGLPDTVQTTALAVGAVSVGVLILAPRVWEAAKALGAMKLALSGVKGASVVAAAGVGLVIGAVALLAAGWADAQAAVESTKSFAPRSMAQFEQSIADAKARVNDLEDGITSVGDAFQWFRDAANYGDFDEAWRRGAQDIAAYNSGLQDIAFTTGATSELVRKTAEAVWDENRSYVENKDAVRQAVAAKSGGTDAAIKLAEAELLAGDAASTAADRTKAFKDALLALNSPTLDERAALRSLEESIDAAGEAAKENGRTLDTNTEAGRRNAAALDSIAQDALRAAGAIREKDGNERRANETLATARIRLQAQAQQFGMTKKEAERYVNQVLGIPKKVDTKAQLNGTEAVGSYKDDLATIPKEVETNVKVNIVPGSPADWRLFREQEAGRREHGGPVKRGSAYIVGEKRPELFVPDQNGTIIPRVPDMAVGRSAFGGGGTTVVVNVNGSTLASKREIAETVLDALKSSGPRGLVLT